MRFGKVRGGRRTRRKSLGIARKVRGKKKFALDVNSGTRDQKGPKYNRMRGKSFQGKMTEGRHFYREGDLAKFWGRKASSGKRFGSQASLPPPPANFRTQSKGSLLSLMS